MRNRTWWMTVGVILVCGVALMGCQESDSAECELGEQQLCVCAPNVTGNQRCKSDGTWDTCVCMAVDGGLDATPGADASQPTDAGSPDAALDGGGVTNPCLETGTTHVLISEVATQPGDGEFVEIWNGGASPVVLTYFHLSDNPTYHQIATGAPWSPGGANPGSDFLVRFPPGTTLPAGGVLVVQTGGDFYAQYGTCPDFAIGDDPSFCNGNSVPKMVAPTNGSLGTEEGSMLSNSREMLMLFCWDGNTSTVVDVDYVTWGVTVDPLARVDKTGGSGYQADTAIANQDPAPPIVLANGDQSIGRCSAVETGESTSGGNGSTGHDETSEQMGTTFGALATASPGAVNTCN